MLFLIFFTKFKKIVEIYVQSSIIKLTTNNQEVFMNYEEFQISSHSTWEKLFAFEYLQFNCKK